VEDAAEASVVADARTSGGILRLSTGAGAGAARGYCRYRPDPRRTRSFSESASRVFNGQEELQALGLPGDIAEMLANEKIEYPLLVERIVAVRILYLFDSLNFRLFRHVSALGRTIRFMIES